MAADELSPVLAGMQPRPLGVLGESSAFPSPSRNAAPWQGDRSATKTPLHIIETPVLEEVGPGAPRPSPLLLTPAREPPAAPSTCGGDLDGEAVAVPDGLEANDGAPVYPFPATHPPNLDAEGDEHALRQGAGERAPASPPTDAALPGSCEGRQSPGRSLDPVEEGDPAPSARTEADAESEEEKQRGGGDGSKSEDGDRGGEVGLGSADECGGAGAEGGENGGGHGTLLLGSRADSEDGESTTPSPSLPATPFPSGDCKGDNDGVQVSPRPADEAGPNPPSPGGQEAVVAGLVEGSCVETKAAQTADGESSAAGGSTSPVQPPGLLLPRPSEPSECAETTIALARSPGAGLSGGVGEVDSDDDPDGILSDNSRVDSDDGTAVTSQSAKGGACGGKRSSSPAPSPPLYLEPVCSSLAATDGFGGASSDSSSLAGAVLEAGGAPFSPSRRTEPVLGSSGGEAEKRGGGLTGQEWHDGMSPLTSPAVEGPCGGGDGRGGFACSQGPAAVVFPQAVTSDHEPKEQQRTASMVDRGEEVNYRRTNGSEVLPVFSISSAGGRDRGGWFMIDNTCFCLSSTHLMRAR